MVEKLLLVAEPKAALVSPSDTFLTLGNLHVGNILVADGSPGVGTFVPVWS
jgi:hypothetical protein